ncbi:hypothetical protein ACIGEZ_02990 [Streptomyces sp. NPDC085481]|uniref:hypothetical protein n=1 Tax=Streptomyces sp. NPDC085481 TaxID=3365727 RepID=UPI0037D4E655
MTTEPPLDRLDTQFTAEKRALAFVAFAVEQTEYLAPLLPEGAGLSGAVRVAVIESFWVNVRLLAEFLVKGTGSRDWQARDFAPGWTATNAEARTRLSEAWVTASRHVMHLSKDRTPAQLNAVEPVSAELYRQVAEDCREVYDEFVANIQ